MKLMGRDSIAIVPTAPVRLRNNDVEYAYRPDSDFFYLTGFAEPDAVAVLVPGRPQGEYILFVRDRDPARETWDGRRAGPDGATRDYGADHAFPIADIDEILPGLLENRAKVFYAMGTHPEFDQRVVGWVNGLRTQARNGRHPPQEIVALDHVLHDMRLFKSRAEVDTMREAARIAAQAHVRAMRACVPGKREYEIAAEVVHEFRLHNADTLLPAHRRRRRQRLHPALPRERCGLARRRPAAHRCRLRSRVLRLGHHAHLSGQRPLLARAAARCTKSCSTRTTPPSSA